MLNSSRGLAIAIAVAGGVAVLGTIGQPAFAQSGRYKLQIINKCNRTIYVARRIKALSGVWTSRGWIVVRARQTANRTMRTNNRVFYLYAVSADRKISWHGYRKPRSVRRPVVMRRFTHTSGPIDAAEVIFVHFAEKRIPQGKIGFRQTYLCSRETGGASAGGGRDPGSGGDRLPELGPNPGNGGGAGGGGATGGGASGGGASGGGAGGGTQVGAIPPAMRALNGRSVWVMTKTRPPRDYCAMLRRAGLTVRCSYERNSTTLNTMILRCGNLNESHAGALKRYLGLRDLPTKNWQRENACGRYNEITIYLNR